MNTVTHGRTNFLWNIIIVRQVESPPEVRELEFIVIILDSLVVLFSVAAPRNVDIVTKQKTT